MAKESKEAEGKANYHDNDIVIITSTDVKFDKEGVEHEVGGHTANIIINKGWAKFKKYVKQYEA